MAVHELLHDLKSLLEQEISLHQGLKDDLVFESEQDGRLTGADYLRLQHRKYQWAARIQETEAHRLAQVGQLARTWQVDEQGLTLREIIRRAPQPLDGEFTASREALLALVEEIRNLARETGANANARLKAIDATLAVIGEAARLHPTYSERGRLQQKPPTFKATSA